MRILELFSGTGIFSRTAEERGHEVLTLDIDPRSKADMLVDIRDVSYNDIITFDMGDFYPDLIWASPPCNKFSVARIYDNWLKLDDGTYLPRNESVWDAIWTVKHTLRIIDYLEPVLWFMENPVGMLGKMPFMEQYERIKITQCQYGRESQKPTYIWGSDVLSMDWKKPCKRGSPCHVSGKRGTWEKGSVTYLPSKSMERSALPRDLCLDVIKQAENWRGGVKQSTLLEI